MHELIVNSFNITKDNNGNITSATYKGKNNAPLDIEFILKYTHGFFDDKIYEKQEYQSIPKTYHPNLDRNNYSVPNGASLSAYIMGDNDLLVKAGLNGAISIYPETIGYNNYNPDAAAGTYDAMLKNARVPMYGQQEKTPEWAEKICGVPADTIRWLADLFASKKVTTWLGGGWQRQSEGEQGPLNVYALGAITKQFGEPGRHVGTHSDRMAGVSFSIGMPGSGAFGMDNPVYQPLFGALYAKTTDDYMKYMGMFPYRNLIRYDKTYRCCSHPLITCTHSQCCIGQILAANGGTKNSLVNDGQVKNSHVRLALFLILAEICWVINVGITTRLSIFLK